MNDKDKEAFDDFIESNIDFYSNAPTRIKSAKEAWQAACEYKQKEIDEITSILDLKKETNVEIQAQNKKLREALEFYADENNMVSLTGLPFGGRAREALKELGGT